MADARALVRLVDELLWTLRREGLVIAPSQAIDAIRVVHALGWASAPSLREGLACVVVTRRAHRATFDAAFDRFFAPHRTPTSLWERLTALGFASHELDVLRELLAALAGNGTALHLGAILERGPELDRLLSLAGVERTLHALQSPLQAGFVTHRILRQVGVADAERSLGAVADRLRDALGTERADALVAALREEIARATDAVRAHVRGALDRAAATQEERGPRDFAFSALDPAELEDVRRAMRRFAERLRGGERVRRRHAARGRFDAHRTLRRAMRTAGVPVVPLRRARRRDRPELMLLCDVSDSVRAAARFMLELAFTAQELFERTRTFVFVSEMAETTRLFARERIDTALGKAFGGDVVPVTANSNYGRALRTFAEKHLRQVTRRTTVVVLGDGRSNYHDDGAEVLAQIRDRARSLYFFCPESRSRWPMGDSAMSRYAPLCTRVLEVRCARELEDAARLLVATR